MIQLGKKIVRTTAEALGYVPSVENARAALERAEADLRELFDANASESKVVAGEEAVREARRVLQRAEHAAASAQRKQTAADDAEAARLRADLIARVQAGLTARSDGAVDIEKGAVLITKGKQGIESAADVIREAVSANLFTPDAVAALRDMQALIRFSLIAAGAMPGPYAETPITTTNVTDKDNAWLATFLEPRA